MNWKLPSQNEVLDIDVYHVHEEVSITFANDIHCACIDLDINKLKQAISIFQHLADELRRLDKEAQRKRK